MRDSALLVIDAILNRVAVLPYPEPCEELRLAFMIFLNKLICSSTSSGNASNAAGGSEDPVALALRQGYSAELVEGISKILRDPYPDCKRVSTRL